MKVEEVRFISREAQPVTLFGKIHYFGDGKRRPVAIVCHPSSAGECDLEHPFVVKVCEALNDSGFITLRFNFRGVAPSGGALTRGRGEIADLRGAVDFVSQREDVDGDAIYAMGHSFGAAMSLRAAVEDDRVRGAVASGLPVMLINPPGSLNFAHYSFDGEGLRNCTKPKLFVRGSHDRLCPGATLSSFLAQLPEPKAETEIAEADHYFRQQGRRGVSEEIARQTAEAIRRVVIDWPKKH